MFKFKKSLEKVNRISNNEDRSFFKLRLDRNEKIFSFNQKYKRKFNKYVERLDLNLYPNLDITYSKLSKYINHKKLYWLEEPISINSLDNIKALKKNTKFKIAGYELEQTFEGWKNLIISFLCKSINIHAIIPNKLSRLTNRIIYKYPLFIAKRFLKSIEIIIYK